MKSGTINNFTGTADIIRGHVVTLPYCPDRRILWFINVDHYKVLGLPPDEWHPTCHDDWVFSIHLFTLLKATSLSQPLDTYIIESFSLGSPGIWNLFSILYH